MPDKPSPRPSAHILLAALFGAACFLFIVLLLRYHVQLVNNPFPLEYREGAPALTTELLLKGRDPFSLSIQPQYTNIYGIVYNLAVFPFAKVFGPTLPVHRAVNGVFILLSASLVFLVLKRKGVPVLLNLGGTALLYAAWLYYTTPLAKPDGLGLFLFLSTLWLPYLRQFSSSSLVLSALLGVAAFYTKVYFVLGIPFLALFLFFFVSKEKGLLYGALSLGLLAASALFVEHISEFYFNNVLFTHMAFAGVGYHGLDFSRLQFIAMIRIFGGVFFIWVWATAITLRERLKGERSRPLIQARGDLSFFCLVLSSILVLFTMGRSSGVWMLYHLHLVAPFLVIWIFGLTPRLKTWSALIAIVLVLNMYYLCFRLLKVQDIQKINGDVSAWQRLYDIASTDKKILASPVLTPLRQSLGQEIHFSGTSEYFVLGAYPPSILNRSADQRILSRFDEYKTEIRDAIAQREFKLIILSQGSREPVPEDILIKNYRLKENLLLTTAKVGSELKMMVWEPLEE